METSKLKRLRRQLWGRLTVFLARIEKQVRWILRVRRGRSRSERLRSPPFLPVIAIDGVGTGTSTVARCAFITALAEKVRQHGHVPHVWLRGLNTRQTRLFHQPKTLDGMREDAFILSQSFPLWVCRHPEDAIEAAAYAGATVLILAERGEAIDARSQFCISVMDEAAGTVPPSFWNLHWSTLARSDALALIDGVRNGLEHIESLRPLQSLIWKAPWRLDGIDLLVERLKNQLPVIGFTGLNDAGVFFYTLVRTSIVLQEFVPLSYEGCRAERGLHSLFKKAQGRPLITTALDVSFLPAKLRKRVCSLSLQVDVPTVLVEKVLEACGVQGATAAVA